MTTSKKGKDEGDNGNGEPKGATGAAAGAPHATGATGAPPKVPSCDSCVFCLGTGPLYCKAHPPTVRSDTLVGVWPIVQASDWCGEYQSE